MVTLLDKSSNIILKNNPIRNNKCLASFYRFLKYVPIETTNKIQASSKMMQAIEKKRQKIEIDTLRDRKYVPKSTSQLLISCSNKQFNHYTGQAYKNFSERYFASYGWRNRASRDQYFTINSLGSHPSLKELNPSIEKINELNIKPVLVELLKSNFNLKSLTGIQHLSINDILKRENHLIMLAETGGGKTLAYGIPMIEICVQMKFILSKMKIERDSKSPLCIILVPTRELVFQVYDVFKKLACTSAIELNKTESEQSKQYIECLKSLNIQIDIHERQLKAKTSQHPDLKINHVNDENNLELDSRPLDILITMPGQLEHRLMHKTKRFNSVYLKNIIMDEADTLLDDSFNETTLKCLKLLDLNLKLKKFLHNQNADDESNDLIADENQQNLSNFSQKNYYQIIFKLRKNGEWVICF